MSKVVVQAALRILIPGPDLRVDCTDDIEALIRTVNSDVLLPRSKADKKEIEKARAALTKARAAMTRFPPMDARRLQYVCDIEAGITYLQAIQDEEKANPRKPKPPSHRQRAAVAAAHSLVDFWLVKRRGLYDADAISRNSPWHKLAQLLFGKQTNLLRYMQRYDAQLKRLNFAAGLKVRGSRKPGRK